MKKIISASIVASTLISSLYAGNNIEVTDFLKKALQGNPNISEVKIEKKAEKKVDGLKGWKAENIAISARVKDGSKEGKLINETSTYFTNGRFFANGLTDMKNNRQITLEPKFAKEFYRKENLISGSNSSKHKVVIFSDPLCPYCKKSVPKMLRILKKHPEQFAVYYYDLPLDSIHPASPVIVKINEKLRADKPSKKVDTILEMYDFDIPYAERNEDKIIKAYNDEFGYKLTKEDINTKKVKDAVASSRKIATQMGVGGTPTFYFDENKDDGTKYKNYLK